MVRKMMDKPKLLLGLLLFVLALASTLMGQLQQSGGAGANASVGAYPAAAPASAALSGGRFYSTPPALTDGQMGAMLVDSAGRVQIASINNALPAGANTIGSVNQAGTWSVNQGGSWSVNQSGTWTVQPGNTANTTPWFVRTVPMHGCAGNNLQDVTQVDVATGAGSNLTSADTCVFKLYVNNKSASPVTVTIEDRQGTPVSYSTSFSLPGNSDIMREFGGMRFVSGVKLTAGSAGALNARLYGVQ
ncbi:MAG: hypothetical protein FJW20_17635 [Acidimicrobiia bacterium]|nr:hypothetical protein [Acidimicrobiia bacterium]